MHSITLRVLAALALLCGSTLTSRAQVISIADARTFDVGDTVTVRGIITRARGRVTYVQQGNAAIGTFQFSGPYRDATEAGEVAPGDSIEIMGELNEFNGQLQFNPVVSFSVFGSGNALPAPQEVTLAEIIANGEDYESELVLVRDIDVIETGTFDANASYEVTDGTDTLDLRTPSGSDTDIGGEPIPMGTVSYLGVINQRNDDYRLFPHNATDIFTPFTLTLLHNNDGESELLPSEDAGLTIGGAALFKNAVDSLRGVGMMSGGVAVLSSGDNFLPGPEFNASLDLPEGQPFYDAIALDSIGYDALCIGNHDFDFGPDLLAEFIEDVSVSSPTYLSANLDFSGEPALQALVDIDRIAPRTVVMSGGDSIGVIGLTTTSLPFISSPGNVVVNDALATIVEAQVSALEAEGINKIVLIAHLQGIGQDTALISQISGVDVLIAGGGDELLANADDVLLPGDAADPELPYPLRVADATGDTVFVVTTTGNYEYLGRLVLEFDGLGQVIEVNELSGPVRIVAQDGFEPDAGVQANVVDPVTASVAGLAANDLVFLEVDLDGRRSEVRTVETNQGNLLADALRWQANERTAAFGVDTVEVALQNGGGIRNDNVYEAGTSLTELNTFEIAPFSNFVSVVADISPEQLKVIMENAVSRREFTNGRFAQVSGLTVVYDTLGTAQELDADGNVTTAGTRVISIALGDGTEIVAAGEVVAGAPDVNVATVNFLARGGDQYPFNAPFTSDTITYQQALVNYLEAVVGDTLSADEYPVGGEGRILFGPLSLGAPTAATQLSVYPNPTRQGATVAYTLNVGGPVEITLFNALGQRIQTLFSGTQAAGAHRVAWDGLANGTAAPAGLYYCHLRTGGAQTTKVIVVQR